MRRINLCLIVLICLMVLAFPGAAQEDGGTPDDLLNALLLTPDTPESRAWFSYADYRGMEYARPGAERPSSLADFLDNTRDTLGGGLWFNALMGIHNGPSDTLQYLMLMGNMTETIGMDFTDVDQAVEWGIVPESVTLFLGDFDEDAIATAYTEREYSASEINGLTVWCNDAVGCEGGMETDIEGRRPEVPFGGYLGQRRPLLVMDHGIAASTQFSLLQTTSNVLTGEERSLGETPEYRTLVEALNDEFVTIQALILSPEQIGASVPPAFRGLSSETRATLYEQLTQGTLGDPIPEYDLVGLVDQASDREQRVYLMLVYDSVRDARTAERRIPDRINDYTSLQIRRPITEVLEDRDAYYVTDIYTSEETGKSVLILDFRAPIAAQEENEETGRLDPSSMVSRLLTQMIIGRDVGWLVPTFPTLEEIEAELGE